MSTTGEGQSRGETEKRIRWSFLEHNGPYLPPKYQPLPDRIPFYYNGRKFKLSLKSEEVVSFYAKTIPKYTQNPTFNKNFFKDWRAIMTEEEKTTIKKLEECNFKHIRNYFKADRKFQRRSDIKRKEEKENAESVKKEYGCCIIDGKTEEIVNYKIERPGLFLGFGNHPKSGKIKERIYPEDITINCSEDSRIPKPPQGHQWKEVCHDNTAVWLAKWTNKIQKTDKYVQLSSNSKLKIEDNRNKFNTAKDLKKHIHRIREEYFEDLNNEDLDVEIRQRATALYLIDQLGFRTGTEKTEETADTVGCCSLRVEHVKLHEEKNQERHVTVFDFLGKSSVRYYNEVSVEEEVFRNLQSFQENKPPKEKLFDQINPTKVNEYLKEQMEGLTAKVFRTYNASFIFETLLNIFTNPDSYDNDKITSYKCANLAVAILLNHRTNPAGKFDETEERIVKIKKDINYIIRRIKSEEYDFEEEQTEILRELQYLRKLLAKSKEIRLNTSRTSFLDPRITTSWCKDNDILITKIWSVREAKNVTWVIEEDSGAFDILNLSYK